MEVTDVFKCSVRRGALYWSNPHTAWIYLHPELEIYKYLSQKKD